MVVLTVSVILVLSSFSVSSFEQHLNDSLLLYNRVPCLDSSIRYKKRPYAGKSGKIDVSVSLAILSVDTISSARMDMSCDVYLMQQWFDKRCHWRPLPKQGSVLTLYSRPAEGSVWTHPGLNNLWQPDTYVLNAKKLSRPETVTHIYAKGIVKSRTRLSLTTSCPMDLQLYPLDRQMCPIIFQSSAHPSQELNYLLNTRKDLVFVQGLRFQEKMIPDFRIMGYKIDLTENVTDAMTGHHFTQFTIKLYLERPLGFFLWEVYMPATFIVLMAFTSFWIDRKATPARVSLGVTTVLTMTTLSSSANANLPPTAYPKAIGIFLAGCFLFTFMALMEYSIGSYLEKRCRRIVNLKIDAYSRVVFPMSFAAFQIIYWIVGFSTMASFPADMKSLDQ